MKKYLLGLLGLLGVSTVHAQSFPTSTYGTDLTTWTGGLIAYFFSIFWGPFGLIVSALIVLALVGMIVRKVRGAARRPH